MTSDTEYEYQSRTKPYNIRLDRQVHAAAAAKAESEDRFIAEVIERLLEGYVDGTFIVEKG